VVFSHMHIFYFDQISPRLPLFIRVSGFHCYLHVLYINLDIFYI
jgi:hypothetical protein